MVGSSDAAVSSAAVPQRSTDCRYGGFGTDGGPDVSESGCRDAAKSARIPRKWKRCTRLRQVEHAVDEMEMMREFNRLIRPDNMTDPKM